MADNKESHFYSQLPLLEEIRKEQLKCEHTELVAKGDVVICKDCGRVWLR